MTLDDNTKYVVWALLFAADEARRHDCPRFEAKLRELAERIAGDDDGEERAS